MLPLSEIEHDYAKLITIFMNTLSLLIYVMLYTKLLCIYDNSLSSECTNNQQSEHEIHLLQTSIRLSRMLRILSFLLISISRENTLTEDQEKEIILVFFKEIVSSRGENKKSANIIKFKE